MLAKQGTMAEVAGDVVSTCMGQRMGLRVSWRHHLTPQKLDPGHLSQ